MRPPADLPFSISETLAQHADELLTEPMSVTQLARLFRYNRKQMAERLSQAQWAEPFGRRWRVAVLKMPPQYLIEKGLLAPAPRPAAMPVKALRPHLG